MSQNTVLTEEERKQHKKEAQQRYIAKQKERLAMKKAGEAAPNYQGMYETSVKENTALTNKVIELEKLCKTYAEKLQQSNTALQRATLEYNARSEYMLDCVRHALVSIQFALKSGNQGGNNGN